MKKKSNLTYFSRLREKAGLSIDELSLEIEYSPRQIYRYEKGFNPPKLVIQWLENKVQENSNITYFKRKNEFKFIDLFAGIGGLRKGFESIGGKCVYTSEWDNYCRETYIKNFHPDHKIDGDITQVNEQDIPEHDVLLAGFPCQPFSIAGVSKKNALGRPHGFLDKAQGTLFFDVARIIKYHQPKAFLLENVKNLVNHDKGNTFSVIKQILESELGYKISCRVINAKSFVPQNRERIFIVGFKDTNNNFDLNNLVLPPSELEPKLKAILHPEDGSEPEESRFTHGKKAKVLEKYTLTEHLWNYLQNYAEKHKAKGNGFGYGLFGGDDIGRTLSARYYKDGSEILIKQDDKRPRRLTPRECARLMGFDKQRQSEFVIPVSDTQAYKQFGNSVVVPVVEAIAKHMMPYIIENSEQNVLLRAENVKQLAMV
ncbi:MAG TPA: DNA (cytosine-5-)-methyltransferase [Candidatus Gastranaerophilales bacterium]|nr:DNA (cytosine-5-)-methyltransferase [Candidatus Gastranaerophilales bacterium]